MPECAHRLMRCRPSLVRGRAAQVNPGGFTTPARRPSVPHRTAGCGKSSLRPLMAGSSPSLPDGSNPSAAIVQSASDVQCSRLLKTTQIQGFGRNGTKNQRKPCRPSSPWRHLAGTTHRLRPGQQLRPEPGTPT
ncbi:transposase [Pseudomonas aeruginosa]|nr:transposase [Pseudomonas aeruginosa]